MLMLKQEQLWRLAGPSWSSWSCWPWEEWLLLSSQARASCRSMLPSNVWLPSYVFGRSLLLDSVGGTCSSGSSLEATTCSWLRSSNSPSGCGSLGTSASSGPSFGLSVHPLRSLLSGAFKRLYCLPKKKHTKATWMVVDRSASREVQP